QIASYSRYNRSFSAEDDRQRSSSSTSSGGRLPSRCRTILRSHGSIVSCDIDVRCQSPRAGSVRRPFVLCNACVVGVLLVGANVVAERGQERQAADCGGGGFLEQRGPVPWPR